MIQNEIINPQPRSETPSSLASKPRMACFGLLGMDVQARQERVGRTYEIARRPSKPEAHTMYIRGIKDDLLAQITREDASLLISDKSESLNADRLALSSGIFNSISICKDKSVNCGSYLKNASKFYLNKYVVDGLYHSKYKNLRMIVGWGIVLGLLYWVLRTEDRRLRTDGINLIYRYSSPILITSVLFTFTSGCGIFTTGGGQGDAPWLLLAGGINSDTPSVQDDGMVVSGGGGGIPFTVPVTGMYFVHSDHLGSVSFLTNGRGAIVAGGEFGGKSDIQYKPYGEIDRPHSSGPDISKYKYTGQEEDKESGLLYYKARYYDPALARFLQSDDLLFPDSSQGMNRMMYVEGNPISYSDPTGQFLSGNVFDKLVKELTSFTMRSIGENIAKGVQRATFLSKTRVDSILFKRENYYTKSDMIRGYRSLGDQYIGYIKDPARAIERSDLARSDLGRLYTNFYRGYINLIDQYIFYNKFPKYAIENSDLARSKIGKKFTQAWKESSDARVIAGISDFPDGGIIFGTIGKVLGLPIIGKIAGIYGLVAGVSFIIRACSGKSDTYCDVSGR